MKRKMFNKVMAASLTATMTMSLAGCGEMQQLQRHLLTQR